MAASSSSPVSWRYDKYSPISSPSPFCRSILQLASDWRVSSSSSSIHLRLSSPRRAFLFSVSLSKSSVHTRYNFPQDLPKLNRCRELLAMQEELKQARKAFEVDEKELVD